MKKLFLGLILAFTTQVSFAQAWEGPGDQKLQVGIQASGNGNGLKVMYDYGIHQMFSVGAGADIFLSNRAGGGILFVYGRTNFHLSSVISGMPKELDVYPGVNLGVIGDAFSFGAHLGARYFFTPKFGIFGEFGNRNSLGLSINL
jgi:hypothetical protein